MPGAVDPDASESIVIVTTEATSTFTTLIDELQVTESLHNPIVRNITINQRSDFIQNLTILSGGSPVDLDGYTVTSHIKKHPKSSSVSSNFATTTINAPAGELRISLGSTMTSNLKEGKYYYDIVLINNDSRTVIQEGMVLVKSGITT